MNKRKFVVLLVVILTGAAGAYAIVQQQTAKPAANARREAPPVVVTVAEAKRMNVPVELTANGNVSSLNSVDIRPQVTNTIARVHIREGQFVKAGDILFSLDDRTSRVNLQKAEAQAARTRASLADLERQLARSQELSGKGFISQSAVDTVRSQAEAQRAALQADVAAVQAARVALSLDTIRASSTGRAGAISVFAGSLVQPSSPPLVTISQLDPIAVSFTIPETELGALLAGQKDGGVKVMAAAQDGRPALEGRVSFIDNTVDPQNGTIRVKAVFPNRDQALWPGQYAAIRTTVRELKDAVVIPQAAIITGIENTIVYAVGPELTVQPRRIRLVHSFGTDAAVTGIEAGEKIVVDGRQNLRPGARVRTADGDGAAREKNGQGRSGQKTAP